MNTEIEIGRLLRAGISGCVVGCRVAQSAAPVLGGLVRIPLEGGLEVYGLIHDIHIDDDGLVRQLVTAENVAEEVLADNRVNRNVPVELSVLHVGYRRDGRIWHLLPPRPPFSLDRIYLCSDSELRAFTAVGRFGYFRHILRAEDVPIGELLAAHIQQASAAHQAAGRQEWAALATQELITLLRDDYPLLMGVLSTLGDASLEF
jgi:hypothetical protein